MIRGLADSSPNPFREIPMSLCSLAARAAAVLILAGGVSVAPASIALAQESAPTSGMTRFLPPVPAGWTSVGPEVSSGTDNDMEPPVGQAYGPSDPDVKGGYIVTINHPSPQDLIDSYAALAPPGTNPMAPWMVMSHVKVNGLDGHLMYNTEDGSGILMMKVGRVSVGVQGGSRTPEQIVAFASTIDTDRLLKY